VQIVRDLRGAVTLVEQIQDVATELRLAWYEVDGVLG